MQTAMIVNASEKVKRLEADRRVWSTLPRRKLQLIEDGLISERDNPEADVFFVDERLRLIRKELRKRKRKS